ncbi:SIR2 family NAD-dependent protein deacylase [Herbidospora sp. RD11066]
MRESDWVRLIHGLESGDCIPFLGAGVCSGTLPTGSQLSLRWAEMIGYPFTNKESLLDVMDFAVTMDGDPVYVKQKVIRDLLLDDDGEEKLPDFSSQFEPHRVLARFPLPVFFTTNYDDFMVRALTDAGKKPAQLTCPWHTISQGPAPASRTRPTSNRPAVFHLHGSAADPASLVLSRSDYIQFLITLTKDHASSDHALIPRPLLVPLTERPLLFIGYSLQDWTFAVLFQGLLETVSSLQRRRHISIQLAPPSVQPGKEAIAEEYLNEFFKRWNITVYWGKVDDFCRELGARMGWSA